MRIACTSTPDGSVYRFYRTERNVTAALKPLVPFLLASQVDVVVGHEDDDRQLLLRVGPISGDAEALLLSMVGSFVGADGASRPS